MVITSCGSQRSVGRVLALLAATMPNGALAAGDPVRGEHVFQYCYSCHTVDPNEKATLQGPDLVNIVKRRVAGQTGLDYSPAMTAFAERHDVWSEDLLDRYIADPESLVPNTTMNFGGLDDPQERSDLSESANAITRTRIVRPMRNVLVLFLLILTATPSHGLLFALVRRSR